MNWMLDGVVGQILTTNVDGAIPEIASDLSLQLKVSRVVRVVIEFAAAIDAASEVEVPKLQQAARISSPCPMISVLVTRRRDFLFGEALTVTLCSVWSMMLSCARLSVFHPVCPTAFAPIASDTAIVVEIFFMKFGCLCLVL